MLLVLVVFIRLAASSFGNDLVEPFLELSILVYFVTVFPFDDLFGDTDFFRAEELVVF